MHTTEPPVHYTTHGHTGPWLTLIHGGLVDSTTWHRCLDGLAVWGRILTYDLRGYGKSEPPHEPYSVADHARDLVALWDALDIDRSHVAGFSLGGMIAQEVALTAPRRVDGLVLISTAGRLSDDTHRGFRERAAAIETKGLQTDIDAHTNRAFAADFIADQPEIVNHYRHQIATASPDIIADNLRAVADFDRLTDAESITCPTLVVAGEQDTGMGVEPATRLANRIPHATLTVLRGIGHTTHIEAPSTFTHVLGDYLAWGGLPPSPPQTPTTIDHPR